tara:strand:- start:79 stop:522 length:444 start_codon:yes stop_codon:yes gene_type:complete
MALTSKKHESFYVTKGSGADKVDPTKLTKMAAAWDSDKAEGCKNYIDDPVMSPLIYQLQQMQDEIDYLRTEISANKDKTTFPGLGTSSTTALAGDTNIVTIGSSTTISFGDMITTVTGKPPKTTTTYSVVMTVTKSGVSKSTTLTLT